MSHFDIWPMVKDFLAFLGFLSLLGLAGFFFIMARQALEDRREARIVQRAKARALEALRDKWEGTPLEQH